MRNLNRIGVARARRGGVLALVVIGVLAVATLSASLLQVSTALSRRQASNSNIKQAFYMAESGLAEAYQGLAIGKTGNVGSQALPARFGNGLFWVESTQGPDGTVTLDSTGMVGNGMAELSLVVEPRLSSVAALGVFADDLLDVQPGMVVDGFDSGASAYQQTTLVGNLGAITGLGGSGGLGGLLGGLGGLGGLDGTTNATPLGKMGSNAGIQVAGTAAAPTVIDGDLRPGPGQSVSTSGDVTIHGSTVPAECAIALPAVHLPSYTPSSGVAHSGPVPYLVLPGQHQLPFLEATAGSLIVVQGPATLVLDRLQVAAGAALEFDTTGGPVNLFVSDELDFAPGSTISTGDRAWDVTIQIPGALESPAVLAATSDFHGVVYAPAAAVEVHSAFEFSGSLVGKELNFVGPVQLHFDRHLEELAADLALPRLVSWRIVALSNPNGLSKSMDPFIYLGLDRPACPLPAVAHEDQLLDVRYAPGGGGPPSSYAGMESAFDWGLVEEVYSIARNGTNVNPSGGGLLEFVASLLKGL